MNRFINVKIVVLISPETIRDCAAASYRAVYGDAHKGLWCGDKYKLTLTHPCTSDD